LQPNTPYTIVTLENAVITGGYYLSSHTLHATLFGLIHSFILPSVLTEGNHPPVAMLIRRLIHYFHGALVGNDPSEDDHMLDLASRNGAQDIFALFALAIFLNALDERTYTIPAQSPQLHAIFDLNAIPLVERYHNCYVRGLAFDLMEWYFEHYEFSLVNGEDSEDDIDTHQFLLVPFTVHIARHLIGYKMHAEVNGHTTNSTYKQVQYQVESAIYSFKYMRSTYLTQTREACEEEYDPDNSDDDARSIFTAGCDLDYILPDLVITQRLEIGGHCSIPNPLEFGQNDADRKFMAGVACAFNLDQSGGMLFA
jgi:hypothetical protein